jgi:hypothetical protein
MIFPCLTYPPSNGGMIVCCLRKIFFMKLSSHPPFPVERQKSTFTSAKDTFTARTLDLTVNGSDDDVAFLILV